MLKKNGFLLFWLFLTSCGHLNKTSEQNVIAQTQDATQITYLSPIRDGFKASVCRLKKMKLDHEALAIEIEFENNRGEVWKPRPFVIGNVDGKGKLALLDQAGNDITNQYLKNKNHKYKNTLVQFAKEPRVYEFDFFDSNDFSTIKYFTATEGTLFEQKRNLRAQCRFL